LPVPSLGADEVCAVADEAFQRYTSPSLRRGGVGVAVVWFRNDLRVLDNEALLRAWAASEAVLLVYCVDPRVFACSTHYFGLPPRCPPRIQLGCDASMEGKLGRADGRRSDPAVGWLAGAACGGHLAYRRTRVEQELRSGGEADNPSSKPAGKQRGSSLISLAAALRTGSHMVGN